MYRRPERNQQFHMEAAGSLTPDLEGAPASGFHPDRTKEKEGHHDAARKKAKKGSAPAWGGER